MEHLLTLALEFGLQDVVNRVLENRSVQRVVGDLDPLWLAAWEAYVSENEPRMDRWLERALGIPRIRTVYVNSPAN
jgi:hypothetical protein